MSKQIKTTFTDVKSGKGKALYDEVHRAYCAGIKDQLCRLDYGEGPPVSLLLSILSVDALMILFNGLDKLLDEKYTREEMMSEHIETASTTQEIEDNLTPTWANIYALHDDLIRYVDNIRKGKGNSGMGLPRQTLDQLGDLASNILVELSIGWNEEKGEE